MSTPMNADRPVNGRCTKRRKDGGQCGAMAIAGTDACRRHIGMDPAKARAKGAVVVELRSWGLDGHADLADPGETQLRLVTQSAARVELYSGLLREAFEAAERLRVAHDAEHITLLAPEEGWDEARGEAIPEDPAAQTARQDLRRIFNSGGVAALIGHRFDADRLGRVYAVDEGIRGLAQLEAQERDRCANFAAKAVAAGLAKRMTELAEQQGRMLYAVIAMVVRGVGKDPADPEVRALVASAIQSVTGVQAPAIEGSAL